MHILFVKILLLFNIFGEWHGEGNDRIPEVCHAGIKVALVAQHDNCLAYFGGKKTVSHSLVSGKANSYNIAIFDNTCPTVMPRRNVQRKQQPHADGHDRMMAISLTILVRYLD